MAKPGQNTGNQNAKKKSGFTRINFTMTLSGDELAFYKRFTVTANGEPPTDAEIAKEARKRFHEMNKDLIEQVTTKA